MNEKKVMQLKEKFTGSFHFKSMFYEKSTKDSML